MENGSSDFQYLLNRYRLELAVQGRTPLSEQEIEAMERQERQRHQERVDEALASIELHERKFLVMEEGEIKTWESDIRHLLGQLGRRDACSGELSQRITEAAKTAHFFSAEQRLRNMGGVSPRSAPSCHSVIDIQREVEKSRRQFAAGGRPPDTALETLMEQLAKSAALKIAAWKLSCIETNPYGGTCEAAVLERVERDIRELILFGQRVIAPETDIRISNAIRGMHLFTAERELHCLSLPAITPRLSEIPKVVAAIRASFSAGGQELTGALSERIALVVQGAETRARQKTTRLCL